MPDRTLAILVSSTEPYLGSDSHAASSGFVYVRWQTGSRRLLGALGGRAEPAE
jgi:hypothetical protein